MKWSEEYATGIERIDDHHRMLFKMSEDFRESLEAGGGERVYGSLLRSLDVYARSHFHFEEGCMEQYQCPVARRNKDAHVEFVEMLTGFQQRYRSKGFDRADVLGLVDFLDQWLSGHICTIDVQLRKSVKTP
jgi:hemerythrin